MVILIELRIIDIDRLTFSASLQAASQPLKFVVSDDKHSVSVEECTSGRPLWSASVLERLWLMLDAGERIVMCWCCVRETD